MQDDGVAFYKGMTWVLVAYFVAFLAGILAGHVFPTPDPVQTALVADVVATLVVFAFSFGLGNSSIYDPYWSVAPIGLVAYWSLFAGQDGSPWRQGLIVGLVAFWGTRLTSNWAQGWSGLDHEDWRYVRLRARTGRLYWPVSLLGLHLFPTLIVFLGLLPAQAALTQAAPFPRLLDVAAASVCLGATLVESRADHELRRFRAQRTNPAAVLATGFWRWTRHPNYLGEVLFWWGLWLFAVAVSPANAFTCVGALAIALMFRVVSIPMMERHLLERHPAYRKVIEQVPMLLPWPSRKALALPGLTVEPPVTTRDNLVDERARLMLDTLPFIPPPGRSDDEAV